jgi:hypothetical protein
MMTTEGNITSLRDTAIWKNSNSGQYLHYVLKTSICNIVIHPPHSMKRTSDRDTEHWANDSWHSEVTQCLLGLLDPWRWRHCVPLKHKEPLIYQHSITFQKTWLFRNTLQWTSNLECLHITKHQTRNMKCPNCCIQRLSIYCILPALCLPFIPKFLHSYQCSDS